MKSGEPTQATAERYPCGPHIRASPEHRGKPVASRLAHHFAARRASIDAGNAPGGVDGHTVHSGQVDQEAV